jgi:hypothetical protein
MKGRNRLRIRQCQCRTAIKFLSLVRCGRIIEAVDDFDLRFCPCTVAAVARASRFGRVITRETTACCRSDEEIFSLRYKGPFSGRFVRKYIDGAGGPDAFQAEYEGSIPFTRSNDF